VTQQRLPRREDSLPHSDSPIGSADWGIDLADDDIEHSVEELFFVGYMLVERHRDDAELIGELAHAQRIDPGLVGQDHGRPQHAVLAQGHPTRPCDLLSHLTECTTYTYTPNRGVRCTPKLVKVEE